MIGLASSDTPVFINGAQVLKFCAHVPLASTYILRFLPFLTNFGLIAARAMRLRISNHMLYTLAFLQLFTCLIVANNCYYPHGNIALTDVVCFPSDADSFCCGPGYACLENKLCMRTAEGTDNQPIGSFDRGSCTDASFNSSACPQFCTDAGSKYIIIIPS